MFKTYGSTELLAVFFRQNLQINKTNNPKQQLVIFQPEHELLHPAVTSHLPHLNGILRVFFIKNIPNIKEMQHAVLLQHLYNCYPLYLYH